MYPRLEDFHDSTELVPVIGKLDLTLRPNHQTPSVMSVVQLVGPNYNLRKQYLKHRLNMR
jgi:hypothetical protein